jgi:hypothetical protein
MKKTDPWVRRSSVPSHNTDTVRAMIQTPIEIVIAAISNHVLLASDRTLAR